MHAPPGNPPFDIALAEDNFAALVLPQHKLACTLHVLRDAAEVMAFIGQLDGDPQSPNVDLPLLDVHLAKRDGEDIVQCFRATERYVQTRSWS